MYPGGNSILRDILQNSRHVIFKRVKIMKVKERLRNSTKQKETNLTVQCRVRFSSGYFCYKEHFGVN